MPRFAGIAWTFVGSADGSSRQVLLRGNLMVSPSPAERVHLCGQRGVTGYQEIPRVPFIDGDFSLRWEVRLEEIERQINTTVIAELANGVRYTLANASVRSAFELNTRDGIVHIRWEGLEISEEPIYPMAPGTADWQR